jgi:hypothetical protein
MHDYARGIHPTYIHTYIHNENYDKYTNCGKRMKSVLSQKISDTAAKTSDQWNNSHAQKHNPNKITNYIIYTVLYIPYAMFIVLQVQPKVDPNSGALQRI